ncbi:MAG: tyrosine-type recombinase/integrase, partial [Clostridia bacterium]
LTIEKTRKKCEGLPSYVTDFIIYLETSTSPLTRLNYVLDLKLFFNFLSSKIFSKDILKIELSDLNSITSKHIDQYLSFISQYNLNGKNLSNNNSSKSRKLSSIRSLFKFLFDRDMILANVSTKVKTPKINEKSIVRLEPNEVAKLINFAENPTLFTKRMQSYCSITKIRDVALLSLLLGTGIRVSECVGIDVDDINFEDNAFKIVRKGGNEVVLYLSSEVAQSLKEWIEERNQNEKIPENEKALFVSLQNKRIGVRAVENLVQKYSKMINPLKNISPHKLRSTYGTNLYRETKDIYIVANVLGHKDVNTTKKHYAAIGEDMRRDASMKVKLR